ncbi:hypothetical protein CBS63078_1737 [Aspergillus niger]|nr:hypothetical protein CBS133816_7422 [Aspergillus niger]KAI2867362.1 hypothetical protein CBS12448_327 [Aspergillus niger]KAI2884448.1 hypothetical protein CBS11852_8698 [Aspergillus niger]KAI2898959.1 hypothetical protein CBS13152_2670 [Aspergillus niger]KAI2914845.1 hypothetical protein CBS147371_6065 [Aspergillus niger]
MASSSTSTPSISNHCYYLDIIYIASLRIELLCLFVSICNTTLQPSRYILLRTTSTLILDSQHHTHSTSYYHSPTTQSHKYH